MSIRTILRVFVGALFLAVLITLGATDGFLLEQGVLTAPPPSGPAPLPVTKRAGPAIPPLLEELGYEAKLQRESNLLEQVTPPDLPIDYRTILQVDRLGTVAWIDTPQSKAVFRDLKQKLLRTFSNKLSSLIDETTQAPDGPVVNRLSFSDPAISPDRFVFLRVRERLYEIHIAPGQEAALDPLLAALASR